MAFLDPALLICPFQIQAKYTDCLLLNKHDLCTERQLDTVLDHLYELNDETPVIRVSKDAPLDPSLIFGLDTKLFARGAEEVADWEAIGGAGKSHVDEVETRSVWRGGARPGAKTHKHDDACGCDSVHEAEKVADGPVQAVDEELLRTELAKLPFEIYRGELICHLKALNNLTPPFRSQGLPPPTLQRFPDGNAHPHSQLGIRPARADPGTHARHVAGYAARDVPSDDNGRSWRGGAAGAAVGVGARGRVCVEVVAIVSHYRRPSRQGIPAGIGSGAGFVLGVCVICGRRKARFQLAGVFATKVPCLAAGEWVMHNSEGT